jgi:hypothetical protein
LRRDQAIVGVAGRVAPLSEGGLVAGLLQLEFSDATLVRISANVTDDFGNVTGLSGRC